MDDRVLEIMLHKTPAIMSAAAAAKKYNKTEDEIIGLCESGKAITIPGIGEAKTKEVCFDYPILAD